MSTTTPEAREQSPPPSSSPSSPPVMALRTYMALRAGAVGVILVLAVSIAREYSVAGDCLQGSISAYYYTSVQSVFVGTLVALGLVMIVLWGKTAFEDAGLNLAGLLAPVVAFVPTDDTNKCGLVTSTGAEAKTPRQQELVVDASHAATDNNLLAYFVVVGAILLALLVLGVIAHTVTQWSQVTDHPLAFWGPWAGALVLWLLGIWKFASDRDWIYAHAHQWSAIGLFVVIVLVVINIGFQKWRGKTSDGLQSKPGAYSYWTLAALMVAGALVIVLVPDSASDGFVEHRTFFLEAWMIGWLAIFWSFQTWDRRNEGAPPRTEAPTLW